MRKFGIVAGAAVFAALLACSGCTPGAPSLSSNAHTPIAGATIVHVSLIKYAPQQTEFGTVAGYSPDPIVVAHGTTIQFVNDDTFDHTATSVGSSGFPNTTQLPSAALNASGSDLAQAGWSTGDLRAGAFSQGFLASQSGTFYFGCFFHFGTPMRGVIVVQ